MTFVIVFTLAVSFRFVTAFLARYTDLSLLVNNAGLNTYGMRGAQTTDGFEMAYGVNYIGHFYLTSLLLPILRASAPSRIINVA